MFNVYTFVLHNESSQELISIFHTCFLFGIADLQWFILFALITMEKRKFIYLFFKWRRRPTSHPNIEVKAYKWSHIELFETKIYKTQNKNLIKQDNT